jgi:hypothetical protein
MPPDVVCELTVSGESTRSAGTTIATSDRAVIKTPEDERAAFYARPCETIQPKEK